MSFVGKQDSRPRFSTTFSHKGKNISPRNIGVIVFFKSPKGLAIITQNNLRLSAATTKILLVLFSSDFKNRRK